MSIRKHLEDAKQPERVAFYARINKELKDQVEKQLEKDGLTWVQFVEASMKAYLEESKKK